MSFNKIILVGNLGKDPELRYTPQGDAVCSFSMATNERKKDKSGEFQNVATWFKVTLWRKQAELAAKFLTKGSSVYVEGRVRLEDWTDREGNLRSSLEVQGTDMQFIGGGRGEGSGGEYSGGGTNYDRGGDEGPARDTGSSQAAAPARAPSPTAPVAQPAGEDDDIPF